VTEGVHPHEVQLELAHAPVPGPAGHQGAAGKVDDPGVGRHVPGEYPGAGGSATGHGHRGDAVDRGRIEADRGVEGNGVPRARGVDGDGRPTPPSVGMLGRSRSRHPPSTTPRGRAQGDDASTASTLVMIAPRTPDLAFSCTRAVSIIVEAGGHSVDSNPGDVRLAWESCWPRRWRSGAGQQRLNLLVLDLKPAGWHPGGAGGDRERGARSRQLDVFQVLSSDDVRQLLALERTRQLPPRGEQRRAAGSRPRGLERGGGQRHSGREASSRWRSAPSMRPPKRSSTRRRSARLRWRISPPSSRGSPRS
jgi:hypothetical protein